MLRDKFIAANAILKKKTISNQKPKLSPYDTEQGKTN